MQEKATKVQRQSVAAVHVAETKIKFLQAKLHAANKENETTAATLEDANREIEILKERAND